MSQGKSPVQKRPRRSLSTNKTTKSPSPSIISYFNNAPPAKLACSVCHKMVPRYDLIRHLDESCANDGDFVQVEPTQSGLTNPTVSRSDLPSIALEDTTPQKLSPPKRSLIPARCGSKLGTQQQTSPYFKDAPVCKNQSGLQSQSVEIASLGSLSSKLSSKYLNVKKSQHEKEGLASHCPRRSLSTTGTSLLVNCSEVEDQDEMLSGSQKENRFSCASLEEEDASEQMVESRKIIGDGSQKAPCGESARMPTSSDHGPTLFSLDLALKNNQKSASGDSVVKREDARGVSGGGAAQLEACSRQEAEVTVEIPTPASANEGESNSPTDTSPGNNSQELREGGSVLKRQILKEGSSCDDPRETTQPPPSHPYYLRSFLVVLQAIRENEEDMRLFDDQEKGIITKFYQLSGILCLFALEVFFLIGFVWEECSDHKEPLWEYCGTQPLTRSVSRIGPFKTNSYAW